MGRICTLLALVVAGCWVSSGRTGPGEDVGPVDPPWELPLDVPADEPEEEPEAGCTSDSDCDDGDPCTRDSCDVMMDRCRHYSNHDEITVVRGPVALDGVPGRVLRGRSHVYVSLDRDPEPGAPAMMLLHRLSPLLGEVDSIELGYHFGLEPRHDMALGDDGREVALVCPNTMAGEMLVACVADWPVVHEFSHDLGHMTSPGIVGTGSSYFVEFRVDSGIIEQRFMFTSREGDVTASGVLETTAPSGSYWQIPRGALVYDGTHVFAAYDEGSVVKYDMAGSRVALDSTALDFPCREMDGSELRWDALVWDGAVLHGVQHCEGEEGYTFFHVTFSREGRPLGPHIPVVAGTSLAGFEVSFLPGATLVHASSHVVSEEPRLCFVRYDEDYPECYGSEWDVAMYAPAVGRSVVAVTDEGDAYVVCFPDYAWP